MAVQYTPQFIPTNTQALQGVLSEYQSAYDKNLARELEVKDAYSMIPTISANDTLQKNQILGEFSKTLKDIEKKYNYDRASSAYSKELASKISQLRSMDFWSYNERKKAAVELDQKMRAQLGSNYFSPNNPLEATYQNQDSINNYRPMNLEDLQKNVMVKGTEYATQYQRPIQQTLYDPRTGQAYAQRVGTQFGFATEAEARDFLNTHPEWLVESMKGTGFENYIDNPTVMATAYNAALSSLIGKPDASEIRLPDLDTGTSGRSGKTTPLITIGNETGDKIQTPIKVKNASDYIDIKRDPKKMSTEEGKRTVEYIDYIKDELYTDDKNAPVINEGKKLVRGLLQRVLGSDEKADELFDKLLDDYNANKGIEGEITGDVLRTVGIEGGRIKTFSDFVKENSKDGTTYTREEAQEMLSQLDSWYRQKYHPIAKEFNKRIKEGYRPTYTVDIPGMMPESDISQLSSLMDRSIKLGGGSPLSEEFQSGKGKSGESMLFDPKALEEFNAIAGKADVGFLRSEGRIPKIRLVKEGKKLDFTFQPEISQYEVWTHLASKLEDPEIFMDVFYSGYNMLENTDYTIDNTSKTYIKDISKMVLKDGVSDKKIEDNLKGLSWGKYIDQSGDPSYIIKRDGTPITEGITSKEELFSVLTNIAIK